MLYILYSCKIVGNTLYRCEILPLLHTSVYTNSTVYSYHVVCKATFYFRIKDCKFNNKLCFVSVGFKMLAALGLRAIPRARIGVFVFL